MSGSVPLALDGRRFIDPVHRIRDHFRGGRLKSHWLNVGTAGTIGAAPEGVFRLTTAASAVDRSMLVAALACKPENGPIYMAAKLNLVATLTDLKVFVGITDSLADEAIFDLTIGTDTLTAVADDAVGFLYDDEGLTKRWMMAAVNATVVDVNAAFVAAANAPVADTDQWLSISIDQKGNVLFEIDDKMVGRFELAIDPSVQITPVIMLETTASSVELVDVDAALYEGHIVGD